MGVQALDADSVWGESGWPSQRMSLGHCQGSSLGSSEGIQHTFVLDLGNRLPSLLQHRVSKGQCLFLGILWSHPGGCTRLFGSCYLGKIFLKQKYVHIVQNENIQ